MAKDYGPYSKSSSGSYGRSYNPGAGGVVHHTAPSRQERVNPFEETGHLPGGAYDTREYIKSPILKPTGDVQGPSLPEEFRSKNWIPELRILRDFKKLDALQKARERMRKVKSWIDPFIDDDSSALEWSGILGPAWGSLSIDPLEGKESLIGAAGFNVGPFSGQYTGGPGTDEMIDVITNVGPVNAYYSPTTEYGALQGGMDLGPVSIMGGIDTLKNKNLAIQLGLEFSKGGLATMFERRR